MHLAASQMYVTSHLSNHQSAVMKRFILFSAFSITLLASCSTAYKAGQTPDDVYYSPGREIASAKEEEKAQQEQAQYEEYISSQDDRYLRMKVANRSRWNSLDDYDYWYDSRYDFCRYNAYSNYNLYNNWSLTIGYGNRPYMGYGAGYGYGYGYGWNSPVYTLISYGTPKFSGGGGYTSGSNISAYRNKTYNNTNYGYIDPKTGSFKPSSNNSSFGNLLKRVFTTSSGTSVDRAARTFDNSSPNRTSTTPPPATSSNAGGSSGGFKSTGSSTSTGRGGRG